MYRRSAHHAGVFDLNSIFFLFFIAQFFEQSRHSRLITMIHRQETMSFLGFPIARYIDIDLLLHTPGGLVLAAEQIA